MKRNMKSVSGVRGGILMLELMVVLALMASTALVLAGLMTASIRAKLRAEKRDTMIARVDLAMDLLRRDVWGAREIRLTGDGVELADAEGGVQWRMKVDGVLERIAGDKVTPFIEMPRFGFSAKGALLTVGVDSGPGGKQTHEEAVLVSERMLGGGT